jgi:hypothetical protein
MDRLVNLAVLLGLIINSVNSPISLQPAPNFLNQRFPCETRGCGCNAARCWTTCSCSTPLDKLRWSVRERVAPPSDFLDRMGVRFDQWEVWVERVAADPKLLTELVLFTEDVVVSSQPSCCCSTKPNLKPTAFPPDSVTCGSHSACGTPQASSTCCSTRDAATKAPARLPSKQLSWDTFRCGVPATLIVFLFGECFVATALVLQAELEYTCMLFIESISRDSQVLEPPTPPPKLRMA